MFSYTYLITSALINDTKTNEDKFQIESINNGNNSIIISNQITNDSNLYELTTNSQKQLITLIKLLTSESSNKKVIKNHYTAYGQFLEMEWNKEYVKLNINVIKNNINELSM